VACRQTKDPDQFTPALKNPKFLRTPSQGTLGLVNRTGQLAWPQADHRTLVLRFFPFSDLLIQYFASFSFRHLTPIASFAVPLTPGFSLTFPRIRLPFALDDHMHDSGGNSFNRNFHFILLVRVGSPAKPCRTRSH
jgi:hypothetical protein